MTFSVTLSKSVSKNRIYMQKGTNLYKYILMLFDMVGIVISIYLTIRLRVYLNPYFSIQFTFHDAQYLLPPATIIVVIWIILFYQTGRYDLAAKISALNLSLKILKSISIATVVLMVVAFLSRSENYSRSLIMILWAISFVVLTFMNILGSKAQHWLKSLQVGVENIAIIGYTDQAISLAKKIKNVPRMPYNFCGYILPKEHEAVEQDVILGNTDEASVIINKHMLDRIILCSTSVKKEETLKLAKICEKMNVHLDIFPDIINLISKRISLTGIDDIPLIEIKKPGFTRWEFAVKRAFDLSVILVLGIVLFPLLSFIAVLIKLDSQGPVFYIQKRTGKGGKYFSMYKFRSMFVNADGMREELESLNEADGYLFKIRNDPRITRVGKILRKFSLDELPQIINVLKGNMSLVGPRPLPSEDLEKMSGMSGYSYWFEERNNALPGVTGLWQVNGRSDAKFDELVTYDMYYLENWSLWLDFQIFIKTIPVMLRGRGAY